MMDGADGRRAENGNDGTYREQEALPLVSGIDIMGVESQAYVPQHQHHQHQHQHQTQVQSTMSYTGPESNFELMPSLYPTEKVFNYVNDCSLTIGNTPSGFTTMMIHITDTPFFGVGTLFSTSALEMTNAEIHYGSKSDFLLDESVDPNSPLPVDLDKDRRLHKISMYKVEETGEYRIDFVKMSKTGIPELDIQDPWKDFDDMDDTEPQRRQIELIIQFTDLLRRSKDEPDMVLVGKVPEGYPEIQPCVGTVMFKRAQ